MTPSPVFTLVAGIARRATLALLVLLLALPLAVARPDPAPAGTAPAAAPGLVVDGPQGAVATVRRTLPLAQASVEERLGPIAWSPLHVRITTAGQDRRTSAPDWAAAYASPGRGIIVLREDRIGAYPNGSLRQVLVHELAHIALGRRLGGAHELPRWFEEGLAMSIAREMGPIDAWQLSLATLRGGELEPEALDDLFGGGQADAQAGYALAFSLVRHMENEAGPASTRQIVDRVARGEGFEHAVRGATGRSLAELLVGWRRGTSILYRWVPIVTSTVTLWLLVTGLLFVAWSRKQRRIREIRRRWAIEDGEWREVVPVPVPVASPEAEAEPPADRVAGRPARAGRTLELDPDDATGPFGPH